MNHHSENPRREVSNGEAGVVGAVLGFGLVALALYLAVARFHIRKEQLVEAGLYLFIITAAVTTPFYENSPNRGAQEASAVYHPGTQGRARHRGSVEAKRSAAWVRHGREALVVAG